MYSAPNLSRTKPNVNTSTYLGYVRDAFNSIGMDGVNGKVLFQKILSIIVKCSMIQK